MRVVELIGAPVAPRVCWSCSDFSPQGQPLCSRCRAALHRLSAEPVILSGIRVWAPLAYAGPARDLVRGLKFRGAIALADTMAAQIVANAPPDLLDRCTAVPVPLHPRRLRSRGYNQAAVIAEAIGRRAGIDVAGCLARSGPSVTQVGRDRAERKAGPAGSITVSGHALAAPTAAASTPAAAVPRAVPERVLLVDDVVTTGATLGACRDALVAAGATDVAAVCFARTIGR